MERKYEGMFLIRLRVREQDLSAGAEDVSPEAVAEEIKKTLIDNGAEVIEEEVWDKRRRLAYEIDHETEAMYYRIVVKMQPSVVNKVRDLFRINDRILRFVFFALKDKTKEN